MRQFLFASLVALGCQFGIAGTSQAQVIYVNGYASPSLGYYYGPSPSIYNYYPYRAYNPYTVFPTYGYYNYGASGYGLGAGVYGYGGYSNAPGPYYGSYGYRGFRRF